MNIEAFHLLAKNAVTETRKEKILKEKTAESFEEIFARHLVSELTKDTFRMEGSAFGSGSGSFYREFITDALARELAARRTLGMADLVTRYWEGDQDV